MGSRGIGLLDMSNSSEARSGRCPPFKSAANGSVSQAKLRKFPEFDPQIAAGDWALRSKLRKLPGFDNGWYG
jgi:hypothetical protein